MLRMKLDQTLKYMYMEIGILLSLEDVLLILYNDWCSLNIPKN